MKGFFRWASCFVARFRGGLASLSIGRVPTRTINPSPRPSGGLGLLRAASLASLVRGVYAVGFEWERELRLGEIHVGIENLHSIS
jgi:hypothetical protein